MESGFSHVIHTLVMSIVFYVILVYVLKQSRDSSIDKSILLGTILLMYMILFGHHLPTNGINPNIIK